MTRLQLVRSVDGPFAPDPRPSIVWPTLLAVVLGAVAVVVAAGMGLFG